MTLDERLRDELQALERSAPTQSAHGDPRERRLPWTRYWLGAATVLVGIVATSLALGPLRSLPVGHASPSANPPVVAQTSQDDLILTLSSTRSTWTTEDAIEVVAIVSYVGDRKRLDVGGGGGPIVFALRQLSRGDAVLGGGQDEPCIMYPVGPDSPLRFPFSKAGAVNDSGPFDRSFFEDPDLHLPPGRWEVIADLQYGIDGCDDLTMRVAIELEVVSAAASADHTPALMATPTTSTRTEGTEADCGSYYGKDDCDRAVAAASSLLNIDNDAPNRIVVGPGRGRGLSHMVVLACYDDVRYTLIDVIMPADGPLSATVRSEPSEPLPFSPCR